MRSSLIYIIMMIMACILFCLELSLGSVDIPFSDVLAILSGNDSIESWNIIVIETRLPRAMAALVCGLALSVSGLMMQTLFRNPLAGPHILGVSSGASLGVAIVVLGIPGTMVAFGFFNDIILVLAAFIGAMGILMTLFIISTRVNDILTVLIFGILLGSISLALVGIMQYLSPESQLKAFLVWTLGSFDSVELKEAVLMSIVAIPLLFSLLFLIKPLNLLLAGEEYAITMGLNTKKSRLWIMILAGALTAMVTAFCGPIGFVGVVVPHFSRMILKTFDHKKLLIGSLLIGMNVMLFADLLAHLPGSQHILPINSITALIGIPFIFWMLIKRKMIEAV